jgi:hypothetical protein
MVTGRPMKFKTPEELQTKIDKYFNDTPKEEYSITGLALALDTYRETLCNYEKRDEFFDTIKRAKQRIENAYELRLIKRGTSGDIFALKNFGWTDKQEIEQTNINKNEVYKELTAEELKKLAGE